MTEQVSALRYYRPGSMLALALIGSPALISLATAGVALVAVHRVPLIVPLLLLLYLVILPLTWFLLISVRTTSTGIAFARPWLPWRELSWEAIERAQQRWLYISLTGSSSHRVVFAPALLRDGARLRREIFVRLAPQVLDERLRADARVLLADHVVPKPGGGLAGTLEARPRLGVRILASAAALLALMSSVVAVLLLRSTALVITTTLALIVLSCASMSLLWLQQQVDLSDSGVRVTYLWPRRQRIVAWNQVLLLEHTPAERMIRLRGEVRLTCAGPALLRSSERDVMRAFLNAYCVERGVPVVERLWLL